MVWDPSFAFRRHLRIPSGLQRGASASMLASKTPRWADVAGNLNREEGFLGSPNRPRWEAWARLPGKRAAGRRLQRPNGSQRVVYQQGEPATLAPGLWLWRSESSYLLR